MSESTSWKKRGIVQYVLQMRDRLEAYREQAGEIFIEPKNPRSCGMTSMPDIENISLDRRLSSSYHQVQSSYWQSGKSRTLSSGRWA